MITNFVKTTIAYHVKHFKDQLEADRERLTKLEGEVDELRVRIASNQSIVNETEAWLSSQIVDSPATTAQGR